MSGRLDSPAAQRAFFAQKILVHTHIEKAAGTSLVKAFLGLFGGERIHDLRPDAAMRPREMDDRDKARIWVLTGHFPFGSMDGHFARQKVYIASVRDPVARFLSFYRFVKASPTHPAHRLLLNKSPEEVIEDTFLRDPPLIVNDISRSLGIARFRDIASQLEKSYAIVAPCERVSELIAEFCRIFGRPDADNVRFNVGSGETVSLAPEARLILRSRNRTDSALYEYVNERFDSWLNDLEARLCRQRAARVAFGPTAATGLWRRKRPRKAGEGASACRPLDRRSP